MYRAGSLTHLEGIRGAQAAPSYIFKSFRWVLCVPYGAVVQSGARNVSSPYDVVHYTPVLLI